MEPLDFASSGGNKSMGTSQFPHLNMPTVFSRLYRATAYTVDIIQHSQQRTVRIFNVARVVGVVRTVRIARIIRVIRTKKCHQFVHAPILVIRQLCLWQRQEACVGMVGSCWRPITPKDNKETLVLPAKQEAKILVTEFS